MTNQSSENCTFYAPHTLTARRSRSRSMSFIKSRRSKTLELRDKYKIVAQKENQCLSKTDLLKKRIEEADDIHKKLMENDQEEKSSCGRKDFAFKKLFGIPCTQNKERRARKDQIPLFMKMIEQYEMHPEEEVEEEEEIENKDRTVEIEKTAGEENEFVELLEEEDEDGIMLLGTKRGSGDILVSMVKQVVCDDNIECITLD